MLRGCPKRREMLLERASGGLVREQEKVECKARPELGKGGSIR
jgi:hypothetical protein